MDQGVAVTIAIGVAFFGGVLVILRFVLSRAVGWHGFAEKYPVKTEFQGDWKVRQSGYFKDFFFPDCMDIGADEKSLYIAFRFPCDGFERVQIPWASISDARKHGKAIALKIDGLPLRIRQSSFSSSALAQLVGNDD